MHVDKDNMSALNVMVADQLVRCPDKAAIFRCVRAQSTCIPHCGATAYSARGYVQII